VISVIPGQKWSGGRKLAPSPQRVFQLLLCAFYQMERSHLLQEPLADSETTIGEDVNTRYLRGVWGGTPAKCVGEAHYPQVSGPICSPHSFLSCLKSLADFSSATESSLSFFFHLPHWMKAQSASYVAGWPLRGEVVMAVFVSAESKYCSLHLPIIVFYFVSKSSFASLFQCNCSCFLPRFLLFPRKFLLYWLTEKTLHH
jgi:hypothetical protein